MLKTGGNGGTSGAVIKKVAQKKAQSKSSATPTNLGSGGLGPQGQTLNIASTNPGAAPPTAAAAAAMQSYNAPAAPAAAPAPQTVPPPFLTADQLAALRTGWLKDKQTIVDDTALQTEAKGTYDQNTAVNAQNKSNALDINSQSMGARGMSLSSINDASIADIGATYAANQFNYDTAYNTAALKYGSAISAANTDIGNLTDQYTGDAILNAQQQTPDYQPGQPMPTSLNTTFDINSLLPAAPTAVTPGTTVASAAANGVGAAGSTGTAASSSATTNPLIAASQTNPMATAAQGKNS